MMCTECGNDFEEEDLGNLTGVSKSICYECAVSHMKRKSVSPESIKSDTSENLTITNLGSLWFWQIFKILKISKICLHGFLGWYTWRIVDGKLESANISFINVRPFIGSMVLRHELGHHRITRGCTLPSEAKEKNDKYDSVTKHGLAQWRYKEDYF